MMVESPVDSSFNEIERLLTHSCISNAIHLFRALLPFAIQGFWGAVENDITSVGLANVSL